MRLKLRFKNTYIFLVWGSWLQVFKNQIKLPLSNNILFVLYLLFILMGTSSCAQNTQLNSKKNTAITVGANRIEKYIGLLKNKSIAVVANQTSAIFKDNSNHTHLVDSLLSLNITVTKVFAPEHGFRGKADAGEIISDGKDPKTNLPIVSLYGKNKKPSPEQLKNIDLVLFDIQDVGVRFYTYISTLHYVMEACAEAGIPVIILDRPNPNGHYIDGPVLESTYKSFVGMHPIPVVYGMTIGEYAQMINGEQWLKNKIQCDITVIPLRNYHHNSTYNLPIKPSPNLPNAKSINLYPSLCLFEGTNISCGRGTEMQFQIFGSPYLPENIYEFNFTPQPNFGAKYPKHKDQKCNGLDLRSTEYLSALNFSWLINAYRSTTEKEKFFNNFFTKLAGTEKLQQQIEQGLPFEEIKASWQQELNTFKKVREKYLLY